MTLTLTTTLTLILTQPHLCHHPSMQYSGLVKDYHHKRWELFFDRLADAITEGKPYDSEAYRAEVLDMGRAFGTTTAREVPYPTEPVGEIVRCVLRWRGLGGKSST